LWGIAPPVPPPRSEELTTKLYIILTQLQKENIYIQKLRRTKVS
jgi:hypothetical protein